MPVNNLVLSNQSFDTIAPKFGTAALSGGWGTFPAATLRSFPFTIDFWFKRAPNAIPGVIFGQRGAGGYTTFWIALLADGTLSCNYAGSSRIGGSINYADSSYHHCRAVFTSSSSTLCVDGAQIATVSSPAAINPGVAVGVGAMTDGYQPLNGGLDEVRVFNVALPTSYTVPTAPDTSATPNLVALYHLDGDGSDSSNGTPVLPVATITASPTSVPAGSTGQVITVTGVNTTFSGSSFTVSGGRGALITAQAATSATTATVTLNPGLVGYGPLTITDTISGATASIAVATPNLGPLIIGCIGNSIMFGTNGSPCGEMASYLTAQGYTTTIVNRAISGSGTLDWLPSGTNLPAAIAAFLAAGVTIVQIELAGVDAKITPGLTVRQHTTNMSLIVRALVAAGLKVVIHKMIFSVPNVGSPGFQVRNDPNTLYNQFFASVVATLVDGVHVFQGDTGSHTAYALNTSLLAADGLHPANAAANILLGDYWALGILRRFGPPSGRWSYS